MTKNLEKGRRNLSNFLGGEMRKSTYFCMQYLYFLEALLLGIAGIIFLGKTPLILMFSILFIVAAIIGIIIITVELILDKKGEITD